jgi:hypothetical protein
MKPSVFIYASQSAKRRTKTVILSLIIGLGLLGSSVAQAEAPNIRFCAETTPAAEEWLVENQRCFGNVADPDKQKADAAKKAAMAAFEAIVAGRWPWPDWFVPAESHLDPGTRFQMAMGPTQPTKVTKYGQPDTDPGGWGTFNNIKNVEDVREYLAVLPEFKPEIDRVNIYVVVIPMPVKVGPVGPQVNPDGCTLYAGGWSQFEISAGRGQRMQYLQLESSRVFGKIAQPVAEEAE